MVFTSQKYFHIRGGQRGWQRLLSVVFTNQRGMCTTSLLVLVISPTRGGGTVSFWWMIVVLPGLSPSFVSLQPLQYWRVYIKCVTDYLRNVEIKASFSVKGKTILKLSKGVFPKSMNIMPKIPSQEGLSEDECALCHVSCPSNLHPYFLSWH